MSFLERAVIASEKAGDLLSSAAKALAYNNLGNTLERLGRHGELVRPSCQRQSVLKAGIKTHVGTPISRPI